MRHLRWRHQIFGTFALVLGCLWAVTGDVPVALAVVALDVAASATTLTTLRALTRDVALLTAVVAGAVATISAVALVSWCGAVTSEVTRLSTVVAV